MPQITIPLVPSLSVRTPFGAANATKDARAINCIFTPSINPAIKEYSIYAEKRPGFSSSATLSAGNIGVGIVPFSNKSLTTALVTAWGTSTPAIYAETTSMGTIDDSIESMSGPIDVSGVEYVFFRCTDGTGWFLPYDTYSPGDTSFTGDTHSNTIVDNISGASALYVGQTVTGSGIPANTRIASVDSATQITLTQSATATATTVSLTRGNIAKILDADFPTSSNGREGNFVGLDGYIFTCTAEGRIYNSALNNPSSWAAGDYLTANTIGDPAIYLAISKGMVVCFGSSSIEYFRNSGNPTGSPLSRIEGSSKSVGLIDYNSATFMNDDIYFCSSVKDGGLGIYKLNGFDLEKISTPHVDRLLGTQATGLNGSVYLGTFTLAGLRFVQAQRFSLGTTAPNRTMVFCVDTGIWSEWDNDVPTFYSGKVNGTNNIIYGVSRGSTSGKLYTASTGSGADISGAYTMTLQTKPFYLNNGAPFSVKSVEVLGDKRDSGTASLLSSDDDYATFSTLGSFDLTAQRKIVRRCGYYKSNVVFKLTESSSLNWRASALVVDWEPAVR